MPAPLLNRRDIDFLLYDWLKIETLFQRERYADHSRDVTDALLDLSAELAENEFLTHYKKADRDGPELTDDGVRVLPEIREAVKAYVEAGFMAASFSAELGGLQLPFVVHSASMAYFKAASIATAAYPMLTIANAHLLAAFATPAQVEAFLKPQIEGKALGTMCLSEPQAGSSLGDITTRADADGEDALGRRFRLTGNKMWISGGDHDITDDIVHLVLAKVPGPDGKPVAGVRGISLFAVPKRLPGSGERNDVVVAGLNHKMGYRGTSNCLLNFGEGARYRPGGRAGAVGYLVGELGQGLAIMFHMMNEARIGVGLGAAALGYRSYMLSLDYARERLQGRALEAKDPAGAPVPIIRHADVKLMLLAQKAYVEGALALGLYCARLIDEQASAVDAHDRLAAENLLGLLTPVAKTWPSEYGLMASDLAIQIHGGYGYTQDFDVEQLYRDNRLNPIHEGTTGVQGLDLLGRKVLRDEHGVWDAFADRVHATIAEARLDDDLRGYALDLGHAWAQASEVVEALKDLGGQPSALWNATSFLRGFGHIVMAWIWLDQAVAASALGQDADPFVIGKLRACRYFYEYELPKAGEWLAIAASTTSVAAHMPEEAF